jgi:hypothetical protein
MLGLITVPQFKLKQERMKICDSCEFNTKGLLPTCSVCNCILHTKTLLTNTKCPKNKW